MSYRAPQRTTQTKTSLEPRLRKWTRGTFLQERTPRKLTFGCLFLESCSSDQSSKVDTHKELIKTLKELKVHLPADKKAKGKASTLATLKYALRSVKQVKGTSASHICSKPIEICFKSPQIIAWIVLTF